MRRQIPPIVCENGVCQIELTRGKFATVDEADIDLVSGSIWQAKKMADKQTWYAQRRQAPCLMHMAITGWDQTDHINGDGLDNRRCNLRQANTADNCANQRSRKGTSKYKGVSYDKQVRGTKKWQATMRGHRIGRYVSEEEAARNYDRVAREHFGEFAALNFPELGERSALVDYT